MVTLETFRKIALAFPDASEEPHFEKTSFRVKKKIFATYDAKTNRACLKLSELQQDLYSIAAKEIIYPVPNKWGKQGWTLVELSAVKSVLFKEAVATAYEEVAGKVAGR
ncbi:MAG: hypothetical protein CFE21_17205 [Bacteroidetes bacterium B1(2017)]|nr:MAG: hypothetical protein CFE21_17205 [Bacteroidetes bacterium B1(2017)]